jgi:biotin carboxyl carrier protein
MPSASSRVGLALLLALGALGCPAPAGPAAPEETKAPAPTWVAVRVAGDEAVLEAPARVLAGPGAAAMVTPPMRATVVRLRVRPGDSVDAGAPLVDVLMPEVLEAAGRHEGARARLEAWTERRTQLAQLRAEGLARALDVSEAAARVAEARAELQAARAVLVAAGLREGDAAGLLSGTGAVPLRAPIAGVVTAVTAALGESREPGAGPLVQLVGTGAARVEARLPRAATPGDWRLVTPAGEARVKLVGAAPAADPRDGVFLAWFEPEGDAALTAGLQGRVVLRGTGSTRLHLVPATALQRRDGVPGVVTRKGHVPLTVVRCEARDCLVDGALEETDEVQVERAP